MKFLLAFLQVLPATLGAIKAIEDAYQGVPGTDKKQLMLNAIQAGAQAGQAIPHVQVQAYSAAIDLTVQAFNRAGIFQSRSTPRNMAGIASNQTAQTQQGQDKKPL